MEENPPDMHQGSRKKEETGKKMCGGGISAVYCGGLLHR